MSTLPPTQAANPRLGDWLRIGSAGAIEIRSGKVELGQGVLTALSQVAAEELDVDVARIEMTPATTDASPDEGLTAGSLSIQQSGAALRQVCAEVRDIYLGIAADKLAVPKAGLTIDDGQIRSADGATTSYWELADDILLDRQATGEATPKPMSAYRVVGTSVGRLDLPAKLAGAPSDVHDLTLDGMVYGRVIRPPSRGATLRDIDTAPIQSMPGIIAVVRDGDFLAVIAEHEEVALRAADRLRRNASWNRRPTLPDEDDLPAFLTSAPTDTTVIADVGQRPPADTARSFTADYHRPYLAHGSIGPSCAVAVAADDLLQIWTHSQGIHLLRREIARALGISPDRLVVRHVDGSGCYGHNGADDVAMDAAMLALAVPGKPVQVVWSRPDELSWSPLGPAGVVRLLADCANDGAVLSWRHEIWSGSYISRPGMTPNPAFLASSHRAGGEDIRSGGEPPQARGGGASRNAVPGYDFPAYQVVNHLVRAMPLRTSALRSLGAHLNVFAAESFMDELAAYADRDPIEFRLAHLSDPRARAVLEHVARQSDWTRWHPAGTVGRGVGYARYKNSSAYCGVVAEVEAVAEVRVRRLTVAVDAGLVINPDGAATRSKAAQSRPPVGRSRSASDSTGTRSPATPGRAIRSCASPRCPLSTSSSCRVRTTRHSGSANAHRVRRRPRSPTQWPTPSVFGFARFRSHRSRSSPRCRTAERRRIPTPRRGYPIGMADKDVRESVIVDCLEQAFSGLMKADPDAFRTKFRKMAADPFAFYRGSACLFYADVADREDRWADDRTSRVWIQGDLHAENFGTYMDGSGVLIFDVNDFDEAFVGHFTWDLQRFAASVALLCWQKALSDGEIGSLLETFVRAYVDQVRWFVDVEDDASFSLNLQTARGAVLSALRSARLSTRSQMLERMTHVDDGDRRFRDLPGVRRLDDAERDKVTDAFDRYLKTIPDTKRFRGIAYDIKDVIGKTGMGIGSAGLPAYTVLIEGFNQALDNDVVLSIKQGNVAAPSRVVDDRDVHEYFKHHGHRTAVSQRALQAHADPLLGYTDIDGVGFVVSEISPYEADLDWSELTEPDELTEVLEQLGQAVAKVHCVSDTDSDQTLVDFQTEEAIVNVIGDDIDDFVADIVAFGVEYAVTVRDDHRHFVEAFREGRIPGVSST